MAMHHRSTSTISSQANEPLAALRAARDQENDRGEWELTPVTDFVDGGSLLIDDRHAYDVCNVHMGPITMRCNAQWDYRGDRPATDHLPLVCDMKSAHLWRRPYNLRSPLILCGEGSDECYIHQQRDDITVGKLLGAVHPQSTASNELRSGDAALIAAAPRLYEFVHYDLHITTRSVTFTNRHVASSADPLVQSALAIRAGYHDAPTTPGPWCVNGGYVGLAGHDARSRGARRVHPISTSLDDAVAVIGVPNEQSHSDTRLARLIAAAPLLRYAVDLYLAHRAGVASDQDRIPSHDVVTRALVDAYDYARTGNPALADRYLRIP